MLPASAVPVKVGVVTLVILSVLETPVSLAAVRSGVVGASGTTLSIVKLAVGPGDSTLLEVSVAFECTTEVPSRAKLLSAKVKDHVEELARGDERVVEKNVSLVPVKAVPFQ